MVQWCMPMWKTDFHFHVFSSFILRVIFHFSRSKHFPRESRRYNQWGHRRGGVAPTARPEQYVNSRYHHIDLTTHHPLPTTHRSQLPLLLPVYQCLGETWRYRIVCYKKYRIVPIMIPARILSNGFFSMLITNEKFIWYIICRIITEDILFLIISFCIVPYYDSFGLKVGPTNNFFLEVSKWFLWFVLFWCHKLLYWS